MSLSGEKCQACEGIGDRLGSDEAKKLAAQVEEWQLSSDSLKISREWKFKDFSESMKFINLVAEIAEDQGHHPDIYCYYNVVKLDLTTHAVKGLSRNDFIMAAKINEIKLS